jgi:hypothetical protein
MGDVSVVCATHKKGVKLGTFVSLLSAAPQRGMFPEISHPQALLGALVFPKNFSS